MEEKLTKEAVAELLADRKIGDLRAALSRMEGADIAELFEEFPEEMLATVYRILPKELAADAFGAAVLRLLCVLNAADIGANEALVAGLCDR